MIENLTSQLAETRQTQLSSNLVLKNINEEVDLHKRRLKNIETYDVDARLNDFQRKLIEKVVAETVVPTQLD